jgi:methanogen homoaconitase large subunit
MGQTISEQILSQKAGRSVNPGDFVVIEPDVVMSHDSLTPSIIKILKEELGTSTIKYPDRLVFVFDHVSPASTLGTADSQNLVRRFAAKTISAFSMSDAVSVIRSWWKKPLPTQVLW